MDTGDTAFMLIATALVMFMTPGLALFYTEAWSVPRMSLAQ